MKLRRLDTAALGVDGVARALDRAPESVDAAIHRRVEDILTAVRARGDAALVELTERYDRVRVPPAGLRVTAAEFDAAERQVGEATRAALRYAAARIEAFHREALPRTWYMTDAAGSRLGQEVRALERVGIYVPGGRAAYPSTVLMTAVPARVAGVSEVVLVSPPGPDGILNAAVLAAARVAGVTEAYRVGGAQAVAALAYGTESIRRVDKIVGPGNIYVALAKSRVFGDVGIDMLAGPSEVVVIADAAAEPAFAAADLLAQAEHDPMARAVLLSPSAALLDLVETETARRLETLPRREIAASALEANGALVLTASLDEAVDVANRLAPEHLELLVADPDALLARVRSAGAVFLGGATPEVVGDYVAGPNHVLPTGGTARFQSALSPATFRRRMARVSLPGEAAARLAPAGAALARAEGFPVHAESMERRA
jgi:histidinol dehydrogenase